MYCKYGSSIDHENVIGDYAHVLMLHCAEEFMGEGTHIVSAVVLPNLKWQMV
jgi:hypothetical protein